METDLAETADRAATSNPIHIAAHLRSNEFSAVWPLTLVAPPCRSKASIPTSLREWNRLYEPSYGTLAGTDVSSVHSNIRLYQLLLTPTVHKHARRRRAGSSAGQRGESRSFPSSVAHSTRSGGRGGSGNPVRNPICTLWNGISPSIVTRSHLGEPYVSDPRRSVRRADHGVQVSRPQLAHPWKPLSYGCNCAVPSVVTVIRVNSGPTSKT